MFHLVAWVVALQDMACDTFLKISNKCKRKFVVLQLQEQQPFVGELLDNLTDTIQDLQPHQIQSFYESVGLMISAEGECQERELGAVLGCRVFRCVPCSSRSVWQTSTRLQSMPCNQQPPMCRAAAALSRAWPCVVVAAYMFTQATRRSSASTWHG